MPECTVDGQQLFQSIRVLTSLHSLMMGSLLGLLIVAGCDQAETNETEVKKEQPTSEPITNEDANKIRNALEAAVKDRNQARFVYLFSKPDLFNLVFDDIKIPTSERRAMESEINRNGNIAALANQIFTGTRENGQYRFVRRDMSEDRCWLLFRFVTSKSREIAYHRYELTRGNKNRVRIRDVYFYLDQESLAGRLRQNVLAQLQAQGTLESMSGRDLEQELESDHLKDPEFLKYAELVSGQKWQEAWTASLNLPDQVRQSKTAISQRIWIAERLGDFYVKAAVEESRKNFPDDLRVEYFAFEYYKNRKQPAQVIEAVDRLYSIVGDPYLNLLKLDALIQTERLKEAKSIIGKFDGTDISPSRLLIHKFEISVSEKDPAESVRFLELLKSKYRIQFDNLSQLPRYADLLKSPEYKKWQFENRQ